MTDVIRQMFAHGVEREDMQPQEVYHCTTRTRAESIARDGFIFPVPGETENRGWKLGYAVYFGADKEYCTQEALNTFRDEGTEPELAELAFVKARVVKGKHLAFGHYETLNEKCGMSRDEWDEATENLDVSVVKAHGLDTIVINDGEPGEEVVVYDKASITSLEVIPADQVIVQPVQDAVIPARSYAMPNMFPSPGVAILPGQLHSGFAVPSAAPAVAYVAAPSVTYAAAVAGSVVYAAPQANRPVYTISPERFQRIMAGEPLSHEEIAQITGEAAAPMTTQTAEAGTAAPEKPASAEPPESSKTSEKKNKAEKKSSKKKLSSKKKSKGCC